MGIDTHHSPYPSLYGGLGSVARCVAHMSPALATSVRSAYPLMILCFGVVFNPTPLFELTCNVGRFPSQLAVVQCLLTHIPSTK